MGGKPFLDECASVDQERVRQCCHLEGETPVEIRIAYQRPKEPKPGGNQLAHTPLRSQVLRPGGSHDLEASSSASAAAKTPLWFDEGVSPSHKTPMKTADPDDSLLTKFSQERSKAAADDPSPSPKQATEAAVQNCSKESPPRPQSSSPPQTDGMAPATRSRLSPLQFLEDDFDPADFEAPPDSVIYDTRSTVVAQKRLLEAMRAVRMAKELSTSELFPEIEHTGDLGRLVAASDAEAAAASRGALPASEGHWRQRKL
eukprot:TRINITY_DN35485_c0_g1_i1.p1 TRINITY_DN35485_c0_g1~~TRINITY_DN35485_c0_g1_i1.p1  ORF type:complete len:258 (-),score=73.76 TRINITY_DN35485_c0_g1_i1:77-850(-)